jgi:hypothetical protein
MFSVTPQDPYGYALTTSTAAAAAYNRGLLDVLRLRTGAVDHFAESIAHDPTFALGHAALALLGHEMCAPIDVPARMRAAALHAHRAGERERSHVHAVGALLEGDPEPLITHLAAYPRDALLLSSAVPTIAFAGVTEVPQQAWAIVERCRPAYGDDWWYAGLLAFVRQEQHRYDEAMDLAVASLAVEPGAGHSAHARAHAHYETGDHEAGLAWMDGWVVGDGAAIDSLSHFSWHAALHELSLGDLEAVRRRYEGQLQPGRALGCRALVDGGSLLFRWALTPGAADVPAVEDVIAVTSPDTMDRPATPFLAMHVAVARLATGDVAALDRLANWAEGHAHPTQREVVAPLARALRRMAEGRHGEAAAALAALAPQVHRLGGSDAQREVIEEARIAALLRASRWDEARTLLDERLSRRRSPRDDAWRATAVPQMPQARGTCTVTRA